MRQEEQPDCVICFEASTSPFHTLPCGHFFHSSCVVSWFRRGHSSCPLCRAEEENNSDGASSEASDSSDVFGGSDFTGELPRRSARGRPYAGPNPRTLSEPQLHTTLLPTLRRRRRRDCPRQLQRSIGKYYAQRRALAAARKSLRDLRQEEGRFAELRRKDRVLRNSCARARDKLFDAATPLLAAAARRGT